MAPIGRIPSRRPASPYPRLHLPNTTLSFPHSHQHQIIQQEQLDELFRLVRRRVQLYEIRCLADEVPAGRDREVFLGARDLGPEGLELGAVHVLQVED